ncbi:MULTISPECIES: nucleoside-diphosphate sugar epimerase/dehydratase [unclassified Brevundimonas]|jgi:O-antigen biosynthesis protein WbqV|uniref:nucleoside-diphosphate sugar epimerase/dehydratase n=1 Tax=unclassified Brevundimonas TaxID=2622653 RepID=UPI00257E33C0|nr:MULTISPECIES: nucleoside-diphosphate sugar epimerase/dehydratase [unclassified Brevundimonas]|tara:strand:+ start:24811 stop:26709 length:1899 start_codon:yes stop_codon:yes gene_type:complete
MRTPLTFSWTAKYLIHIAALFVGFVLAYELRRALPIHWWFVDPDAVRVLGWAGLFALIGAGVEAVFQAERAAWRFASARDVVALARNVSLTMALFLVSIFFVDRGLELPRSVLPLAWLLSLMFLVGARVAWRLPQESGLSEHLLPAWWRKTAAGRKPLLLVGAMADADRQIRHLMADPGQPYQPVGVVTPNAEEVGMRLHGVPFVARLDQWRVGRMPVPLRNEKVSAILFLQDPVQVLGLTPQRIGELKRAGHTLLRPHALTEVGEPRPNADLLTEIPLEEFLPRQPISLPTGPVEELIRGKRILVTGAGGSIGSEIARQMVQLGCGHLTLLDHSEFQLFEIDRELGGVTTAMTRRAVLANVRDEARIREVFEQERPEIVFHAAALKHVALVENNPAEGVLTNVQGTWNVIRAATGTKAAQFVLISTDKAVDPSNVMGATKRIAETLLELVPDSETRLSAVRFGNVLGSAGSVVPIFWDQIARGGPVTVTHPDVNRYFMTIPEAVQLVLHSTAVKAARLDEGPSKFLLEMGEPVRIADLARQMIELSGKTPDVDIKIEFTGLKQGEKIAEILSDDGEDPRPCVDGILEVMGRRSSGRLDTARLQSLISAALGGRGHEVTMLVAETIGDIRKP